MEIITSLAQSEISDIGDFFMKPDKNFIVGRLQDLGKTQTGLGETLKIDRAQATRLINGERRVRLDEVEIIARYLDISIVEMLRRLGLNV